MTNNDDTQERTPWLSGAVSWGQLLVALAAGVASVFMDRLALDRRLTITEERQQFVIRTMEQDQRNLVSLQTELTRRLESVQSQLNSIELSLARSVGTSVTIGNGDSKPRSQP